MKEQSNYSVYRVEEADTLLPFVMKALAGVSRTRAKQILQGGGVRVERHVVTRHDHPLLPGQHVEISRHKQHEMLHNRFVRAVYEDHDIIVIDKQPGILSMATNHHAFCVKTLLDGYFERTHQKCTAHVVHRLDRDTSGLLVYAKNMRAEQILEENWQRIVTDRRYVALLSGRLEQKRGHVESWLKENKAFFTYSSHVEGDGKYALTHYRLLQATDSYSLVELKLETGRKNQIRVHMSDLHHPVCGDEKYGNGDNPAHRLCLHAFRLSFYHPLTSEHLQFETPFPPAFLAPFK